MGATACAHMLCCVMGDLCPEARKKKRLRTVSLVKGRSVGMGDVHTKTCCCEMKP